MKSIKERIKEYSEVIERNPNVRDLYLNRARLYEASKQYKKAVEDYKKLFPGYYICEDILTVCERNGLFKAAEQFYTKEINKDKKNINKYIDRLYFYMRNKEIEKALLDCKTILELSPKEETVSILKRILIK